MHGNVPMVKINNILGNICLQHCSLLLKQENLVNSDRKPIHFKKKLFYFLVFDSKRKFGQF